ncbi:DUF1318 domain-containing protein [Candidatus Pacearchaeota archaeon]|nr:DUF1318 domain-containing protein [Candidatus Pacearchaeota archaeon]
MTLRISFAVLIILLISSMSVLADLSQDDIKKRIEKRDPILTDLKKIGKIGETHLGYIEVLEPKDMKDVGIQKIVGEENKDRKLLYQMIAQQTGTRAKLVGRQNAYRLFQKAEDEEYFRSSDGIWRLKKDMMADQGADKKEKK